MEETIEFFMIQYNGISAIKLLHWFATKKMCRGHVSAYQRLWKRYPWKVKRMFTLPVFIEKNADSASQAFSRNWKAWAVELGAKTRCCLKQGPKKQRWRRSGLYENENGYRRIPPIYWFST